MRFSIYLRRFRKLIKLQTISRTRHGLYIIPPKPPLMPKGMNFEDYTTYHEDGRYWTRWMGEKSVKKLREPLSNFVGAISLSNQVICIAAPMPHDPDESSISLKKEDIVIERPGNFCIETILTNKMIELPSLPERINSKLFYKETLIPKLLFGVYETSENILLPLRFPTNINYELDKNFFLHHKGKI